MKKHASYCGERERDAARYEDGRNAAWLKSEQYHTIVRCKAPPRPAGALGQQMLARCLPPPAPSASRCLRDACPPSALGRPPRARSPEGRDRSEGTRTRR
jgi:hypothetical protein